ncbi:RNA polymerase factor sigma-54 [Bacillus sp. 03113]|uniref:RNA polymerase factor sigma-54 n=1 Tax=Bacillus sp. 03113 TaxID=2578211 RepID=UPI001144BCEE|nr:RNA polymerase factor sigma-54 [Bacillus sp. 03113]
MNLKAGLMQQQTVKLAMTQEMSQAIALLQYSTQELQSFLEDKELENPLLQVKKEKTLTDIFQSKKSNNKNQFDKNDDNWIEQLSSHEQTLQEYLHSQLILIKEPLRIKQAIEYLINSLDENGYLPDNHHLQISNHFSRKEIDHALWIIQSLDPPGVGARSLQECILLQLKRLEGRNDLAEQIITEHFTLFVNKKWRELEKILGVEIHDIQKVFDFIRTLNPKPAADFYDSNPNYIVPDIIVVKENSNFKVSFFDASLLGIKFNEQYYQQFSSYKDQMVNHFLKDKKQEYNWILRSLEQRKETLLKVSKKIVEKQIDFFHNGPSSIKPLTMKEIADELDIHESTVSRAVREKYMQTSFGTFELKFFFSSAIKTNSSEDASAQKIKALIKELISKENKKKPQSDQELVRLLEEAEGVVVSRRTIAKYRDQLGIPSSSKRKRYD